MEGATRAADCGDNHGTSTPLDLVLCVFRPERGRAGIAFLVQSGAKQFSFFYEIVLGERSPDRYRCGNGAGGPTYSGSLW